MNPAGAHRALADCRMCLGVVQAMASGGGNDFGSQRPRQVASGGGFPDDDDIPFSTADRGLPC